MYDIRYIAKLYKLFGASAYDVVSESDFVGLYLCTTFENVYKIFGQEIDVELSQIENAWNKLDPETDYYRTCTLGCILNLDRICEAHQEFTIYLNFNANIENLCILISNTQSNHQNIFKLLYGIFFN